MTTRPSGSAGCRSASKNVATRRTRPTTITAVLVLVLITRMETRCRPGNCRDVRLYLLLFINRPIKCLTFRHTYHNFLVAGTCAFSEDIHSLIHWFTSLSWHWITLLIETVYLQSLLLLLLLLLLPFARCPCCVVQSPSHSTRSNYKPYVVNVQRSATLPANSSLKQQ